MLHYLDCDGAARRLVRPSKLCVAVNLGKFNDPEGSADSLVYVYDLLGDKRVLSATAHEYGPTYSLEVLGRTYS